jgi:mRNA interferase RelE/StbE
MPNVYSLKLKRSAEKELKTISPPDLKRVVDKISHLANAPRPPDCVRLASSAYYRVRQGDWRIIYEVDDAGRIVTVLKIGHRREIYR